MYILAGEEELKSQLERLLKKRDLRFKTIDDFEPSKINNFIENSNITINGIVLLFSKSMDLKKNLNKINLINKDVPIILVSDLKKELDKEKIDEKIDIFIEPKKSVEESILKEIENLEFKKNTHKLIDIITDEEGKVSIFIHNNPDPDAIASAMAFEKICESMGLESTTYYGGLIGHPENEVFLENTGFKMKNIEEDEVDEIINNSGIIVFLDFAEASINNIVPEEVLPDIIIDHHYTNRNINKGQYSEIRTDIGATSTILTRHLQNLNVKIDPLLASALLYGIKVDTNDYTKNISTSDFKVISYLTALADKELLDIFESPPMKSETLSALGRAINNRDFDSGVLTAFAGFITYKDDIPQIAEILMSERDVMSVLVFGILEEKIHMSARSKDLKINIGKKMKESFSDIGSAGGHRHSAGGEVPLDAFESKEKAKIDITRRFKEEVIKR